MKVGFVQLLPELGRVRENVDRAVALIESLDANLVVLPELFTTGYELPTRADLATLAEPADGATSRVLIDLARRRSIHIAYGFAESDGARLYNAALLIGPQGIVGSYRKLHLFMREKELFDAGETAPPVLHVRDVRVGLMICFDWVFPEVARSLALRGAQILAHPSNLVMPWCQAAMLTRSLENRVFSITANRIGSEPKPDGGTTTFTGQSQLVSPRGELLLRAPQTGELVAAIEIDPAEALDKHINPRNDLFAERRPELYDTGRQ